MTRLLAVYDAGDQLMMRFEYADSRVPVKMEKGGVDYYLTYDQVGSLRAVTDAAGAVVKRIDYDSFGNILNDTAPTFTVPFGFAGGLHDRDTGLVRFGFRDYDPEVGRWTAKDPIGFNGGDWNLYGYVLDDPVNFFDPVGLLTVYGSDSILENPTIQNEFEKAWLDSYKNGRVFREQGGWIVRDPSGNLSVQRWNEWEPDNFTIKPSACKPEGAIGEFHTHPYVGSDFPHTPSTPDYWSYALRIWRNSKWKMYIIDPKSIMRLRDGGFDDAGKID